VVAESRRGRLFNVTDFLALPAASDRPAMAEISYRYRHCPRCGEPHALSFRPFQRPIETIGTKLFTHWAICPRKHEPILITYQLGHVLAEDQEMR